MISLAETVDLDCVASLDPLVLDLPAPNRYARGPAAILRRVLYAWVPELAPLEGSRYDARALMRLRSRLEGLARRVAFVTGCSAPLRTDDTQTRLTISARVTLADGRTYPLEVLTSEAGAAILALAGATA
jgi:hypothetical protein